MMRSLIALLLLTFPVQAQTSSLRDLVDRYVTDKASVERRWNIPFSTTAHERRALFLSKWAQRIESLEFDGLNTDSRVDGILLLNRIKKDMALHDQERARLKDMAKLTSWAAPVVQLMEDQRAMKDPDPQATAAVLADAAKAVNRARNAATKKNTSAVTAYRAASRLDSFARSMRSWYRFRDGYDPLFSWWVKKPHEELRNAIRSFSKHLRTRVAGTGENETDALIGDPIGRKALEAALRAEFIPYSPEELIEIAEREFAFCEEQQKKAARELGFFDDWRAAQESVKELYVEPGKQPALIRELAEEAISYVKSNKLVTVPPLCEETWRMQMMSPARQRVTPYFTGGETVSVSYPVEDMTHEEKMMTMRGNNRHFSRAVVHHELIPGHGLQQFMTARHRPWRSAFRTPFWVEGWALYWEMLLWDRGFAESPEDRLGMLFWRKHRCARIIFSLSFHLKTMTADECVDLLVERVGHERKNATAEVRRSIIGSYPPLYQAAYMLGGLQIRALHKEFVGSGKMTDLAFHDFVIQQNAIPIELIRAQLKKLELGPGFQTSWKF